MTRCFYLSSAELHERITCVRFSEILETRFQFIETVHYHYQRLVEVKQWKDEDTLSLSDRVKLLAQKTLLSSGGPAVQNAYQPEREKRQMSGFIHGLRPNKSTAVQLQAPKTMEGATDIANLTLKYKNDIDDVYVTGRCAYVWRSTKVIRKVSTVCAYLSRILETVPLRMCSDFLFQLRSHRRHLVKFGLCLHMLLCVKHV
jgi:hypothetical protein